MAIAQAICTAFKKQLLDADANFATGQDKFKLALYLSTANLSASATAYTATGESTDTGSGDYTAGGKALTGQQTSVATLTAIVDFANLSFTGVTLTARGALIYNTSSTVTNAAVAVLDFGGDKTATAGTFTIQFPAFTTSAAILRIA